MKSLFRMLAVSAGLFFLVGPALALQPGDRIDNFP
jgi:hypothetical protein